MNHIFNTLSFKKMREAIRWQLANVSNDVKLRDGLQGMAASNDFRALSWYWAPLLYARNRALFRPFIAQNFAQHWENDKGRWEDLVWTGEVAQSLDPWLKQLQADSEAPLFKRLYAWKHRNNWAVDAVAWRRDLLANLDAASSPAACAKLLALFDMDAVLDEASALQLFALMPKTSEKFILRHLPERPWRKEPPAPWAKLRAAAAAQSQHNLAKALYQRQVSLQDWRSDVLRLMKTESTPAGLCAALEAHHPQGIWEGFSETIYQLLDQRGVDVLPYVRKHLGRAFSRWNRDAYYDRTRDLAERRGWVELSAALVLICGTPDDYNKAVHYLLQDKHLARSERERRLAMHSGASREWNGAGWGLATVHQLSEVNALALYAAFPQLLRNQFLANLTPDYRVGYFELFEKAWRDGDDSISHYLASRYITRSWLRDDAKKDISKIVADRFVALKLDDAHFARIAAAVLTRIPAYAIYDYNALVTNNRFARLLFERSLSHYLALPEALADLVEASEIHVQQLAYRVLAQASPKAQALAEQNLPVLIGTLLRPLQRRTRLPAFAALLNAAANSETSAARILSRAREALALPDKKYPKEQLVGLIGQILARWPALAQADEQLPCYRRAA